MDGIKDHDELDKALEDEVEKIVDMQLQELNFIDLCTKIAHKVVEKVQRFDEERLIVKHELDEIEQKLNIFITERKPLEKRKRNVIVIDDEQNKEEPLVESLHAIAQSQSSDTLPCNADLSTVSQMKINADKCKVEDVTISNVPKVEMNVLSVGVKRDASGRCVVQDNKKEDATEPVAVSQKSDVIQQQEVLPVHSAPLALIVNKENLTDSLFTDSSVDQEDMKADIEKDSDKGLLNLTKNVSKSEYVLSIDQPCQTSLDPVIDNDDGDDDDDDKKEQDAEKQIEQTSNERTVEQDSEPALEKGDSQTEEVANVEATNVPDVSEDDKVSSQTEVINLKDPSAVSEDDASKKMVFNEGDRVLGKPDKTDIWHPGTISKIIVNKYGLKKYQIRFESWHKLHSTLAPNHIAHISNPDAADLNVGSRIVAARPRDTVAKIAKKYVNLDPSKTDILFGGIVVERACEETRNRFLVFFDDGFAQYLTVKKLHHVIHAADKVWEDVSINCREFLKEYLEEYPYRPMVKLRTGISVQTEWDGEWLQARVVAIDGSLVKMLFDIDNRTEWIYRGSTRLEPLYTELERRDLEALKPKSKSKKKKLAKLADIEDEITKPCFGISRFSDKDPEGKAQMKYWQERDEEHVMKVLPESVRQDASFDDDQTLAALRSEHSKQQDTTTASMPTNIYRITAVKTLSTDSASGSVSFVEVPKAIPSTFKVVKSISVAPTVPKLTLVRVTFDNNVSTASARASQTAAQFTVASNVSALSSNTQTAPAKPSATSVALAKPSATSTAPAKPSATSVPLAKPSATSTAPAKPSATSTASAKPSATSTAFAKPSATSTAVAKPSATSTAPAKPSATLTVPAKPSATSTTLAKPSATSTALAKPSATSTAVSKPSATSAAPARPSATSTALAKPFVTLTAPAKLSAISTASAKPSATSTALAKPSATSTASAKPSATSSALAKPSAASTAPARPCATLTALAKPSATSTVPSKPSATSTALAKPSATSTAPAKPSATLTALAKPSATSTAPARPSATSTASAKPSVTSTAPSKPSATLTALAKPSATSTASAKPSTTSTASAKPSAASTAPIRSSTASPAPVSPLRSPAAIIRPTTPSGTISVPTLPLELSLLPSITPTKPPTSSTSRASKRKLAENPVSSQASESLSEGSKISPNGASKKYRVADVEDDDSPPPEVADFSTQTTALNQDAFPRTLANQRRLLHPDSQSKQSSKGGRSELQSSNDISNPPNRIELRRRPASRNSNKSNNSDSQTSQSKETLNPAASVSGGDNTSPSHSQGTVASLRSRRATREKKRSERTAGLASPSSKSSSELNSSSELMNKLANMVNGYPKTKEPHKCSPSCVPNLYISNYEKKKHNALSIPLLLGWTRETAKRRPGYHRDIYYRSPCNRRMRNMSEVTQYLVQNNVTNVSVDQFCFDPSISCRDQLPFLGAPRFKYNDISYGKETMPIQCVNENNDEQPPVFDYTRHRTASSEIQLNTDPGFLSCCDCTDMCQDKTKCACARLTIESSDAIDGKPDPHCGYHYRRLKECVTTGIYECNKQCSCNSSCYNRVVQNGVRLRLQVFMTNHKGWGLRCLDDIPRGTFICTYTGQILNEEMADKEGTDFGDEYLAEMDHIEIVEQAKEGYESDVPELRDLKKSTRSSSSENSKEESDSDDSESSYSSSSESSDNAMSTNQTKNEASNYQPLNSKPKGPGNVIDLTLDSDDEDENEAKSDNGPSVVDKTPSSLEKMIHKLKTKVIVDKMSPYVPQDTPRTHRKQVENTKSQPGSKDLAMQRSGENQSFRSSARRGNGSSVAVDPKTRASSEACSTANREVEIVKAAKEIAPQLRKAVARKSTKSILQMLVSRKAKCDIENKGDRASFSPALDRVVTSDIGSTCKKFTSPRSSTGGYFARKIASRYQITPPAQPSDKKEPTNKGTRQLFGEENCYVIDAKSFGNVGRYLNHSCMPNLFVQNVFVDTQDLRLPLVAFFAQQNIPALTELTWDYSYDVGSVPGKVLICHCGSLECRGRLL